ncbi:hypothetical protein [uncultured Chitinophaga sp.]|uniref:hypothetical protein n=1 Tax=uncultured Chitinophaga sp. TaxID=339340 RepID=UPI0025EACDD6|nr:hypothetical protein [uncultured Chitinophaga sp.]
MNLSNKYMRGLSLSLVLLAACAPQAGEPANDIMQVNIRDYYMPDDSLVSGKVFCYADNSGEISKYTKYQLFTLADTIRQIRSYDSAGRQTSLESVRYVTGGFQQINGYTLTGDNLTDTIYITYGKEIVPWLQPLTSDSSTYNFTASTQLYGAPAKFTTLGHVEYITDHSITRPYSPGNCIMVVHISKIELGIPGPDGNKQGTVIVKHVLAKGKGEVFSTTEGGLTASETHRLVKVISVREFEAMFHHAFVSTK